MKKGFNILMMIVGVVLLVSACSKSQRTYTEMLKDERKAIKSLIDKEGIILLDDYPENGVFGEKEFVQLSSGLYINVVDSGNGNRAVLGSTKVMCRFVADYINVLNDTTEVYDVEANGTFPITFTYTYNYTIGLDLEWPGSWNFLYSSGMVEPLSLNNNGHAIGDGAIVNLIVPFKIGCSAQQSGGDPVYFKKLRYVFEK